MRPIFGRTLFAFCQRSETFASYRRACPALLENELTTGSLRIELLERRTLLSASWNVVLLDAQVPDAPALARAVMPGTKLMTYNVTTGGPTGSADAVLSRVIDWARGNDVRVGSLSILSHGHSGAFELGDQWIDDASLARTAPRWKQLADVLVPDASIDLYGCDVAAPGGDGRLLIRRIAQLTGRAVFASTNLTGSGGDWNLEAGSVPRTFLAGSGTAFPFNSAALAAYPDALLLTIWTGAAASPGTVTARTTALSVSAIELGLSSVIYTWSTTGTPPAAVTFSDNGTTTAKNTTATFTKAGTYHFQASITDSSGGSATSTVSVTVTQTMTSITVSPATAALNENQTKQFGAVSHDQFGLSMTSQPTFTWSKVSGVGGISASGIYTAPYGVGSATLQAVSGAVSGTANVTVTNAAPTVSGAAAVNPSPVTGTAATLTVLGTDDGGESNLNYNWVTTGTPPAVVTFSANGTNAAKNTTATFTKFGTYTFHATITDAGGLSTTSSVSVTVNQTLTSISVSPATVSLNENQTKQFSATAYDQFAASMATQPGFTWGRASGVGGMSSTGLYTAPGTTGVATITATSGSVSRSATITVTDATPTVATAAAATPAVVTGSTNALSVLGADDGGEANLTYTWAATDTAPGLVKFSTNGTNASKTTTATFKKTGSYTLVVTITDPEGLSVTSSVGVTVGQVLTTITITPTPVTVAATATQQFTATGYDQFGVVMANQPSFTWGKSSGIGSISSVGLYTAPASTGNAVVAAANGSVTATASITVSNTAPTVAAAATAAPSTVIGTTTALNVLGADNGGESDLTYAWMATAQPDGSHPTFSSNGNNSSKASTVTFDQAGSYRFQVTVTDTSGATATSSVDVTVNQTLTTISVSPANAALNENQTCQFTASALDQFGQPITSPPSFTWSKTMGVGSINSSGLYTAPGTAGSATITAVSGMVSGTAALTVTNGAPTVTAVAAASPSPVVGTTTVLSALGADDGGESNLTYTWITTGTAPAVVTFSANGTNAAKNSVATFTHAGVYNFQVTITDTGGLSVNSSVSVTVNQTLTSIHVSPATVTLNENQTEPFGAVGLDQFGQPMASVPPLNWVVPSGTGTIDANGLYSAGGQTGATTVTVSSGSIAQSVTAVTRNLPPAVVTPAAASPSVVPGTSTTLSALASDDGGEANLIYTWSVLPNASNAPPLAGNGVNAPTDVTASVPTPVVFWPNGTNASKNTTATFTTAGAYRFVVTITDTQGGSVSNLVTATVVPTFTSIVVTATQSNLDRGGTEQVSATALDQFTNPMPVQPAFTWSTTGGSGSVDSTGQYVAPDTGSGTAVIQASSGSINSTTAVGVTNDLAVVVPNGQSTTVGTPLVFSNNNAISVRDSDPRTASVPLSVTITASNGTVSLSGRSGLIFAAGTGAGDSTATFTGDIQQINAALRGMSFAPTSGFQGTGSISMTVNETGGQASPSGTVPITVNAAVVPATPVTVAPGIAPQATTVAAATTVSLVDQSSNTSSVTTTEASAPVTAATTIVQFSTAPIIVSPAAQFGGQAAAVRPVATAVLPPAAPAKPTQSNTTPDNGAAPSKPNAGQTTAAPITIPSVGPITVAPIVPDVVVRTRPEQVFKFLAPQSQMLKKMDTVKNGMTSQASLKVTAGTATGMSVGASAAYLVWLLRGGSLVSGLLSMIPAWKTIDPLPVLDSFEQSRKARRKRTSAADAGSTADAESSESLESLVDRSNQASPTTQSAPAETTRKLPS